ncbi:MAG: hypothetical protein ACD_58C00065G0001 [uncultured bacterium]|nr:MAG: hypothetical protein ACD_58C00065G0001 [uncultured bacterium]
MHKSFIIIIILIIFSYFLPIARASISNSDNYIIEKDTINSIGGISTSNSYNLQMNIGEISSGILDSTNYNTTLGYLNSDREYLELGFSVLDLNLEDFLIPDQITTLASFDIYISSYSTNGYTLYIKSQGNTTNPGLYKSTGTTHLIESSTTTLAQGTEGYGLQASSVTATIDAVYLKINNNVGGLSIISQIIASNIYDTTDESVTITPKISITYESPAGNYEDSLIFDLVGNY